MESQSFENSTFDPSAPLPAGVQLDFQGDTMKIKVKRRIPIVYFIVLVISIVPIYLTLCVNDGFAQFLYIWFIVGPICGVNIIMVLRATIHICVSPDKVSVMSKRMPGKKPVCESFDVSDIKAVKFRARKHIKGWSHSRGNSGRSGSNKGRFHERKLLISTEGRHVVIGEGQRRSQLQWIRSCILAVIGPRD